MSRPVIDFDEEVAHFNDLLLHPPAAVPIPVKPGSQLLTAEFLAEMGAFLWERGVDNYREVLLEKIAYCGRAARQPIKDRQSYVETAIRQYCRGRKKIRVYMPDPEDIDE
jgi:hypothetical protein